MTCPLGHGYLSSGRLVGTRRSDPRDHLRPRPETSPDVTLKSVRGLLGRGGQDQLRPSDCVAVRGQRRGGNSSGVAPPPPRPPRAPPPTPTPQGGGGITAARAPRPGGGKAGNNAA